MATYEKLAETAKKMLLSCLPKTEGSNDPDPERILANFAPDFYMDMGHKFFVSTAPELQGRKDGVGFVFHMSAMAKGLQTWHIDITDTAVDVEKRTVILKTEFHMVPKRGEEVLNEILFWVVMDEGGEKVAHYTEFIDPAAGMELAKRTRAAAA